jgi:hypothetical protein
MDDHALHIVPQPNHGLGRRNIERDLEKRSIPDGQWQDFSIGMRIHVIDQFVSTGTRVPVDWIFDVVPRPRSTICESPIDPR